MARTKTKDSEARSFRLRQDICDRLDAYSDKTRIPRTAIVEMALEDFFNKNGMSAVVQQPQPVIPQAPVERQHVEPSRTSAQPRSQLRDLLGR